MIGSATPESSTYPDYIRSLGLPDIGGDIEQKVRNLEGKGQIAEAGYLSLSALAQATQRSLHARKDKLAPTLNLYDTAYAEPLSDYVDTVIEQCTSATTERTGYTYAVLLLREMWDLTIFAPLSYRYRPSVVAWYRKKLVAESDIYTRSAVALELALDDLLENGQDQTIPGLQTFADKATGIALYNRDKNPGIIALPRIAPYEHELTLGQITTHALLSRGHMEITSTVSIKEQSTTIVNKHSHQLSSTALGNRESREYGYADTFKTAFDIKDDAIGIFTDPDDQARLERIATSVQSSVTDWYDLVHLTKWQLKQPTANLKT